MNKFLLTKKFAWQIFSILLLVNLSGCGDSQPDHDRYPSVIERLATQDQLTDPELLLRRRGFLVYQHYCQICHGEYGEGDGFNSSMLDPLPRDFSDENFWTKISDEELVLAISSGGKGIGKSIQMPEWGNTLQADQIDDVIAFMKTIPESVKRRLAAEEAEEAEEDEYDDDDDEGDDDDDEGDED